MAYAGICGTTNLQSNSDPYFHPFSLDEIGRVIWSRIGGSCGILHTVDRQRVSFGDDFKFPACRLPSGMFFQLKGSSARRQVDPDIEEWYQWDHVNSRVQNFADDTQGVIRSYV